MDERVIGRREAIAMLGAAGAALAAGCGSDATSPSASTGTTINAGGSSSSGCAVSPTETIGPFPSLTDLFRSDIREGKSGTPLALTLTVVNTNAVYATGVYAARGSNPLANTADGIFADSINSELATATGDSASGLAATYRVGVAV